MFALPSRPSTAVRTLRKELLPSLGRMSAPAPFRFKLKVKTGGDGACPTSSAQTGGEPLPQRGQDHYAATSSQPAIAPPGNDHGVKAEPAGPKPGGFKLKLKVTNSAPPPAAAPPRNISRSFLADAALSLAPADAARHGAFIDLQGM